MMSHCLECRVLLETKKIVETPEHHLESKMCPLCGDVFVVDHNSPMVMQFPAQVMWSMSGESDGVEYWISMN